MANISKSYIEARGEAINWLNSSKRDFNTGVNILAKSGYKPIIASKLAKQGEKSHTREKLEYEIRQMIKVWYNPNDPRFENVDIDDDAQHGDDGIPEAVPSADELNILTAAEDEAKKEGDEQHYPPVIAKIMYEFKDCYNTVDITRRSFNPSANLIHRYFSAEFYFHIHLFFCVSKYAF